MATTSRDFIGGYINRVDAAEVSMEGIREMVMLINLSLPLVESVTLWRNKPGRYTLTDSASRNIAFSLTKRDIFLVIRSMLYTVENLL